MKENMRLLKREDPALPSPRGQEEIQLLAPLKVRGNDQGGDDEGGRQGSNTSRRMKASFPVGNGSNARSALGSLHKRARNDLRPSNYHRSIRGRKTTFLNKDKAGVLHDRIETLPTLSKGGDVIGTENNVRCRAKIGRFTNTLKKPEKPNVHGESLALPALQSRRRAHSRSA
jgi:hypothetical protein